MCDFFKTSFDLLVYAGDLLLDNPPRPLTPCDCHQEEAEIADFFKQYQGSYSPAQGKEIAALAANLLATLATDRGLSLPDLLLGLGELLLKLAASDPIRIAAFVWDVEEASRKLPSTR